MIRLKKIVPLLIISFILLIFTSVTIKSVNAQTACTSAPQWTLDGTTDGDTSVVYHLFLKNNCAGSRDFNLRVTQTPTSPTTLSGWTWKFANGSQNTMYVKTVAGNSRAAVNLTVGRPTNVTVPEGNYSPVTVRAAMASNTAINDSINLIYIVENTQPPVSPAPTCDRIRPTLEVTPGSLTGAAGEEKSFSVKITNNDSSECDSSIFDLTTEVTDPSWDTTLGRTRLTILPGESKTAGLFVTPPNDAENGPTTITVNTQRPNGALISQNVTYNVENIQISPEPSVSTIPPTEEPTLTPTLSPVPSISTTPLLTKLNLKIGIDGIGITTRIPIGGNQNPDHPNRNLTVRMYNASNNTPANKFDNYSLTFNPETNKFEGTLNFDDSFQSGIYNIFVEGKGVLRGQLPGSVTLTRGMNKTAQTLDLITGDINKIDRSNNNIDLNDYNILVSCSIYSQDRTACEKDPDYERYSDLDDNGIVDEDDFTLWLKEIANQGGVQLPL